MNLTPEDIRFEVRRFLYGCPVSSLPLDTIRHRLDSKAVKVTEADLLAALVFLADLQPPQVKIYEGEMGSTNRYQITSAGILAYERNQ